MNMEERIARINELYHKSQGEGLTADEKEEQARLRREYVASVRNNLKVQLDNITIERRTVRWRTWGKNTEAGQRRDEGDKGGDSKAGPEAAG